MPLPQYPYPVEFQIKAPKPLQTVVKGTLTTLFHNIRFGMGRKIYIISKDSNAGIFTSVRLEDSEFNWEYLDQEINSPYYHRKKDKDELKNEYDWALCLLYAGIPACFLALGDIDWGSTDENGSSFDR